MARQPSKKKTPTMGASAKLEKQASDRHAQVTVYETRCCWGNGEVTDIIDFAANAIGKAILREREIVFDWLGSVW
jgi:hypothetical protein